MVMALFMWMVSQEVPETEGNFENYLDDGFGVARDKATAKTQMTQIFRIARLLGIEINERKSAGPHQGLKILGFFYLGKASMLLPTS